MSGVEIASPKLDCKDSCYGRSFDDPSVENVSTTPWTRPAAIEPKSEKPPIFRDRLFNDSMERDLEDFDGKVQIFEDEDDRSFTSWSGSYSQAQACP